MPQDPVRGLFPVAPRARPAVEDGTARRPDLTFIPVVEVPEDPTGHITDPTLAVPLAIDQMIRSAEIDDTVARC